MGRSRRAGLSCSSRGALFTGVCLPARFPRADHGRLRCEDTQRVARAPTLMHSQEKP